MRIIAGTHRGRPILAPRDAKTTRPITDRVKESLFNRLASLGMLDEEPAWHALDVFSGTGSLGLEALSRGASTCTFVDHDRDAVERLRQNLNQLSLNDRAHIVHGSALAGYWSAGLAHKPVRIAFLDPPYPLARDERQRDMLLKLVGSLAAVIEPGGIALVRTPSEVGLPELPGYDGPAPLDYSGMRLHFYQTPLDGLELEENRA
ncbi:MAG: RsmD family RNA methyltransferase [Planctomycetota bacterium]